MRAWGGVGPGAWCLAQRNGDWCGKRICGASGDGAWSATAMLGAAGIQSATVSDGGVAITLTTNAFRNVPVAVCSPTEKTRWTESGCHARALILSALAMVVVAASPLRFRTLSVVTHPSLRS